MSENSFNAQATLTVGDRSLEIFRLDALQQQLRRRAAAVLAEGPAREPAAHRGQRLRRRAQDIEALASWDAQGRAEQGDRVHARARADAGLHRRARRRRPRRDARRDGRRWAATRAKINPLAPGRARDRPLGPGRRVRHARRVPRQRRARVRAQPASATRSCAGARARSTTSRSCRRTPASSTRSTSSTSRASCSRDEATRRPQAYPDTLVGTDSHTTMVNGLGVLGWGVGGIEAEAAMLGQPMSMLIPQVLGFQLDGELPEGATATDLVLTVTEMLRAAAASSGKFVEFYGPGAGAPAARRPRDDRQHVARSSARPARSSRSTPRRCATCEFTGPAARSRSSSSRPTPASRACGTTRTPRSRRSPTRSSSTWRRRAEHRRPQAPAGPRRR